VKEVNPRLPRVGLRQRVRGLVQLHLEANIFVAASRGRCDSGTCANADAAKNSTKTAILMASLRLRASLVTTDYSLFVIAQT
jgi:hypothetical protein